MQPGLKLAIERGWLVMHESGTYVKFTQAGAEPFRLERGSQLRRLLFPGLSKIDHAGLPKQSILGSWHQSRQR
jgi:hypothetical protein